MKVIQKIGKFYTRVIMKNIGIFIFIGLLSMIFGAYGWFPNKNIYAISQLVYKIILPTMIAYEGGIELGGAGGGILAVLAMTGVISSESNVGILGAMLVGPVAGYLWRRLEKFFSEKTDFRLKMLVKNLSVGVFGGILATLYYFLFTPILNFITEYADRGVYFLLEHHMTAVLSIIIEPAKVFFFNNLIEHAILVPIGINEMQETGRSILFLLESNPGPGMGLLLALYYIRRERREEYMSALIAEAVGGIHEVYFPFALSNPLFILPLILGGVAGNICFSCLDAGIQGVVSPGSIFVILLMAGRNNFIPVLFGIVISVIVTFAAIMLLYSFEKKSKKKEKVEHKEATMDWTKGTQIKSDRPIRKIAFVCDAGMGSSVMGAALLKRTLAQKGMKGIEVEAYAADMIPSDIEFIVCQKAYYRNLPQNAQNKEIYLVDDLVQSQGFVSLVELIQKRNG